jgi:precorrin-6Y C5,15-methyltransferase (decarboxylating)
LTKQAVRAATLAMLAPIPGGCLWDVGAGSGAIAIEWLRAVERTRAVAIERDPSRAAACRRNATTLGVPELRVVEGAAPAALAGLPAPDAVFIGGGISTPGLVEACWQALAPRGRLVANVVTLEGEAALLDLQARRGGSLTRISIAQAEPIGGYLGWRPAMPVTQLVIRK